MLPDAEAVARRGAALLCDAVRTAVAKQRRAVVALSGGTTPWGMLRRVAEQDLPWSDVDVFQVDERVTAAQDPDRNLRHLRESLAAAPLAAGRLHPMPVEDDDLEEGARRYARELHALAGEPPVLDLLLLGLGEDGHTASLVPGDAVLEVADRDVALTAPYRGHRRMTLTFPVLDRARAILWLVTGDAKRSALARMLAGDPALPATRVATERARVLADRAAMPPE